MTIAITIAIAALLIAACIIICGVKASTLHETWTSTDEEKIDDINKREGIK